MARYNVISAYKNHIIYKGYTGSNDYMVSKVAHKIYASRSDNNPIIRQFINTYDKLRQFEYKAMFIAPAKYSLTLLKVRYLVFSYETPIGVIEFSKDKFTLYEYGHGQFSPTTSKQITILTNRYNLDRIHYTDVKKFVEDYNRMA